MASNKNQHFVPRCYLKPFTIDPDNRRINLFNIDRNIVIKNAPVKHQCSGNYFYGKDLRLEKAIQSSEGAYASVINQIFKSSYFIEEQHKSFLRHFWLLQYMRTEAASKRSVEMTDSMAKVANLNEDGFRLEIQDAVLMAMRTFVDVMHAIDDLKVCLIKNKTNMPFITSDDPAVLTNRWHFDDTRTRGTSFGLGSAGNIILLPISPIVMCLGYDGDVYSVPHNKGWVPVKNISDIDALNQHQYMNCRANIFIKDSCHAKTIQDAFNNVSKYRPKARHKINYAILDEENPGHKTYRVIERSEASTHQEALIHSQSIHPQPKRWPTILKWRAKGSVYSNGTGVGYIRRFEAERRNNEGFLKQNLR